MVSNNNTYDVYLGEEDTIKNTTEIPEKIIDIIDYKIYGNGFQQTYTGKNLLPYPYKESTSTINGVTWTDNGDGTITASGTATGYSSFVFGKVTLQPNTIYTFSGISDTKNISLTMVLYDNEKTTLATLQASTVWPSNPRYVTFDTSDYPTVTYGQLSVKRHNNDEVSGVIKPIVEYGTTPTSYEPYVGGKASPNPDYPQEIESVGDKTKNLFDGNIQQGAYLTASGKLSSVTNYISNVNPIRISGIEGDIYTFSRTNFNNGYIQFVLFYDENMQYLDYQTVQNNSFTVIDGAKYINFDIIADNATVTITPEESGQIQLEKGNIATEYEPYGYKIPIKISNNVETITTNIYLKEPLRKIGDYTDYIDFNIGHIKKNVGKVDLGTIAWRYDEINSYFYTSALKNKVTGATNILSTHYPVIYQALEKGDKFIRGSTSNYIVQIKDLDYEDVTTFKEAMNGRMMYYQLTSSTEEMINLPKLMSNNNFNNILIDTKIKPSNIEFTVVKKLKQL